MRTMEITICDKCRKAGSEMRINKWVELRYREGVLANFLGVPNKNIVLCEECFIKLTDEK